MPTMFMPTPAYELVTTEHVAKFFFETFTDIAFLPSLVVVGLRGRHFEFFIGVLQLATSYFYNLCNSLNVNAFLSEQQWHQINNVCSVTYGIFLLIFLMANRNELRDHMLRYAAFAAVWIAQLKDEFWMHDTHYTLYVVLVFATLPLLKIVATGRAPAFLWTNVNRGFLALLAAGAAFWAGLDDEHDPYRIMHGVSQLLAGVALFYLWQAVPKGHYKKSDAPDDLPRALRRPKSGGGELEPGVYSV